MGDRSSGSTIGRTNGSKYGIKMVSKLGAEIGERKLGSGSRGAEVREQKLGSRSRGAGSKERGAGSRERGGSKKGRETPNCSKAPN